LVQTIWIAVAILVMAVHAEMAAPTPHVTAVSAAMAPIATPTVVVLFATQFVTLRPMSASLTIAGSRFAPICSWSSPN